MPSPPTSPTPRETGGVDGAEMDEEQDFFSFQGVTEGQKELGGSKLRGWNKSDDAKMEMDRETTHMAFQAYNSPPHHHHPAFPPSPPFPFPEILSPPVWQLFKLHVHLTQKDPANVPLPRFNRSCFLGSLAALIYLEDRLLIQRDWDARWEESAAVWVLNSSQTPIDSWGWSTFIEQTARKKEKERNGDRTIGNAAARVHDLYMDNCLSTTTITQTTSSKEIILYLFCIIWYFTKNTIQNDYLLQNINRNSQTGFIWIFYQYL